METVNHPHGNTQKNPSMGAHSGNMGNPGGSGAKVRDPGGHTTSMETGGTV